MNKTYVLDACALMALLKNEIGADVVSGIYNQAKNHEAAIFMNRVNLLEVYYGFYHDDGKGYADGILNKIIESLIEIKEFDIKIFYIAGRLKATYKISLADSIALAQAILLDGVLVTSDHHEFDFLIDKETIRFHWIR